MLCSLVIICSCSLFLSSCSLLSFNDDSDSVSTAENLSVDTKKEEPKVFPFPANQNIKRDTDPIFDLNVLASYVCENKCTLNAYDVSGNIWAQATVDNYGNGTINYYDSDTDYNVYANLKKGVFDGKVYVYDKTGKLIEEHNKKDGVYHGKRTIYDQEYPGTKREMFYENGLFTGRAILYGETIKSVLNYIDEKHIKVEEYSISDDKLLASYTLTNRKKEGKEIVYDEDGSVHSIVNYVKDKKQGNTEVYTKDGKRWGTINYKNDKAISGKCGNGRNWTKAELINWENGKKVNCTYYTD